MRINSIKIDKLFEIFDYDISFNNNENLLIITGPNGFGKTMILNILFNLFNKKFAFFRKLVFNSITITLDEGISILITKQTENKKNKVDFLLLKNNVKSDEIEFTEKFESDFERVIQNYLPIRKVDEIHWVDMRTDRMLTIEDIINEYGDQLPEGISKKFFTVKNENIKKILDSIKVHLIKEQRLFTKVRNEERHVRIDSGQTYMTETIQAYAKELKQLIQQNSQRLLRISQELDSSYPSRLIGETRKLSKDEYDLRFNLLKDKQEKLKKNGLYESKQEVLGYSESDAKALLVYLDDLESKLGVFDSLLEKLELFTNILNERRFTFKSIQIDRDKGFYFIMDNRKILSLKELSSGEQHEVVLLYELIFNAKENTLVLIDEPEISLHITWQKAFVDDLLKIIEIQKMQVLIATHSPSIINDRWDLVYNLEKTDTI